MGFCENAIVRLVVNDEGNLICEVCNTRIGLNHSIAHDIIVAPFG
jgi:Fe2+ transport system protein FeoA